jgi:hypothetical protein
MIALMLACSLLGAAGTVTSTTPPPLTSTFTPDEPTKAVLGFFALLDQRDYDGAYKSLDANSLVIMNRFAALMSMANQSKDGVIAVDEKSGPAMLRTVFDQLPKGLRFSPDEVVGSVVQENHAWIVVGYDISRMVQEFSPEMKDDPVTSMAMEMMFAEKLYFTWEANRSEGKWRMDLGFWSNILPLASVLINAREGGLLEEIDAAHSLKEDTKPGSEKGKNPQK